MCAWTRGCKHTLDLSVLCLLLAAHAQSQSAEPRLARDLLVEDDFAHVVVVRPEVQVNVSEGSVMSCFKVTPASTSCLLQKDAVQAANQSIAQSLSVLHSAAERTDLIVLPVSIRHLVA